MDFLSVFLISVGLAMDATAVSIAGGVTVREGRARTALVLALLFGVFQTGMAVAGWFAGTLLYSFISGIDHWIAFILLAFIGGKMVIEGLKGEDGEEIAFGSAAVLIMLAVATSIDSLAVGLSFAALGSPILLPSVVIGVVTALLSLGGFWFGTVFGGKNRERAEVIGGVILILIGLRVLADHLLI
ncbi:manganese efflux pump MntP family protein [uncultured Methanofollis sp.]|uniref:manganese efflux pump MntP n=1 Tax=uncultured Methanofollis sp. TaxID=262500 RepID=UPI00261F1BF0|nr:manganese efflux pump MntP family protein [uncultured Methanofollis sp.]